MTEIKKSIPMTKEFNKKVVNDWLYGYLQSISYVDADGVTFVYPNDVNCTNIAQKCPLNNLGRQPSRNKIMSDLKKLELLGFVKRGNVQGLDNSKVKNAYILPFNENELFKIIPLETLKYIITTMSIHSIKIYIYLLNKFQWKIKSNDYYNFTSKELITECLGLKSITHSRDYQTILFVLDALEKFKLVEIVKDYKKVNGQLTTQWKLIAVKTKIEIDDKYKKNEELKVF